MSYRLEVYNVLIKQRKLWLAIFGMLVGIIFATYTLVQIDPYINDSGIIVTEASQILDVLELTFKYIGGVVSAYIVGNVSERWIDRPRRSYHDRHRPRGRNNRRDELDETEEENYD